MATEHVNMAEQTRDEARSLLAKPAGEQSGLIDALRATDLALDQAERLVEGIEHADDNIAQARSGLDALIAEVRDEIAEATNLLAAPDAANIDRDGLAKAVEGPVTSMVSASALQLHPKCTVIADEAAAELLKEKEYYHWIFKNEPEWESFR